MKKVFAFYLAVKFIRVWWKVDCLAVDVMASFCNKAQVGDFRKFLWIIYFSVPRLVFLWKILKKAVGGFQKKNFASLMWAGI